MKKFLTYLFAAACVSALAACDLKEDRIFDETPDERLTAALTEYSEAMVSAPNGWLMQIATLSDGGYQLYMSFNDMNRVTMLCDMDATFDTSAAMSSVLRESSYKLKALQVPSLIFDTYNYIHQMADPKKEENGMTSNGSGLKSDYEFGIMNYDSRQFTLKGIYNGCQAYMRQATAEEAQAALKGGLKSVFEKLNAWKGAMKNPAIVINDTKVGVDISGRQIIFSYLDTSTNEIVNQTASITMTLSSVIDTDIPVSDIVLFETATVCGKAITGFKWNGTTLEATTEDGTEGIEVYDNLTPIYPLLFGPDGTYQTLTFTNPTAYAGTVSQAYLDTYYSPAAALHAEAGRTITYIKCQFITNEQNFDVLRITAGSLASSGTTYLAMWDISYVKNEDGTYTFSDREASGITSVANNARNYGQKMRGMLDIFSKVTYSTYENTGSGYNIVVDKIEPHTLRIDWVSNRTATLSGPIGAFIMVDDPTMYFCGKLE